MAGKADIEVPLRRPGGALTRFAQWWDARVMRAATAAVLTLAVWGTACAREPAGVPGEPAASATAPEEEEGPEEEGAAGTKAAAGEMPPDADAGAAVSQDLVGTWKASGTDGRRLNWSQTVEFAADGTFDLKGYPRLAHSGRWEVVEREGEALVVRLYDRTFMGSPAEPKTARLELSPDSSTLTWGSRVFSRRRARVEPSPSPTAEADPASDRPAGEVPESLRCRRDADCVLRPPDPCACPPCGDVRRQAINQRALEELEARWAVRRCVKPSCEPCEGRYVGTAARCRAGRCSVE
jgi:hypothetical protein